MLLLNTVKRNRELLKLNNFLNSLTVETLGDDISYNTQYESMVFVDNSRETIYILFKVYNVSNINKNKVVEIIKKWCGHTNYKAVL